MKISLQLVKTQEVSTYLRFEAYLRQNCINETQNSVYRKFHTSVSRKVTCSYLFEAIFKPILFIIIDINTYIHMLLCMIFELFKLPFQLHSPQKLFGITDAKCGV